MARSEEQMTIAAVTTVVAETVGAPEPITVTPTDPTTGTYHFLMAVATAAAPVEASAEQLLFALSFLASKGKRLDNVCKELGVVRQHGETDTSLRRIAPLLFTPGSSPATEIDPGFVEDENEQLSDFERPSEEEIYGLMVAKFADLEGFMDRPGMGARFFRTVSLRLREISDYLYNIATNYKLEDAKYLKDTAWAYEFSALRVLGIRDAVVFSTGYNELTLRVLFDERPGRDARNRRVVFSESEALQAVQELASRYLPQPDRRTLKAPTLEVRGPRRKAVYCRLTVNGGDPDAIRQAVADHFYETKGIGTTTDPDAIKAAVMAVDGVNTCILGSPSGAELELSEDEVIDLGYIDLRMV